VKNHAVLNRIAIRVESSPVPRTESERSSPREDHGKNNLELIPQGFLFALACLGPTCLLIATDTTGTNIWFWLILTVNYLAGLLIGLCLYRFRSSHTHLSIHIQGKPAAKSLISSGTAD
jgi:hypothetical protein